MSSFTNTDDAHGASTVHARDDVFELRSLLSEQRHLMSELAPTTNAFLEKVKKLSKPTDYYGHKRSGFCVEYRELTIRVDSSDWFLSAIEPQNERTKMKNRYQDVLPFAHSLVPLYKSRKSAHSSYINANYVGYEGGVSPSDAVYIACSAPIPAVMEDFWLMVWQQEVHVILMLTNFVEGERQKADQYWDAHERTKFHNIAVMLLDEEQREEGFTVRRFLLRNRKLGEERRVEHVQLTSWPDHGALTDFRVVAPMLDRVNLRKTEADVLTNKRTRVVVHCSAGIGRSGTFITIDLLLKKLRTALKTADKNLLDEALNVELLVERLRTQRPGMVQTHEQYEMIYRYLSAVLSESQPW